MDVWETILAMLVVGLMMVFGPRWWAAVLGKRIVAKAIRNVELGRASARRSKRQADTRFSIGFDAKGFAVVDHESADGHTLQVAWSKVVSVAAFKRDLITVDCISLLLSFANGTELELMEDDVAGWSELAESLEKHLPGCKPFREWFKAMAFPAFATNLIEIYVRHDAPCAAAGT